MEMQMKMEATGGDRLSELPDSILIHILSMLWDSYEVVRTSVLSKRWRFLWMSVPVSLEFEIHGGDDEKVILDFHKELHYWRSCEKIGRFSVSHFCYDESCVQEVDLLVRFATKLANVEEFKLEIEDGHYKFPQFAYKSTSLRNLDISNCQLNPYGSVNWTSLVSLSFKAMNLTDGLMEKVLSGCPSLECLELQNVSGIHRLEITSLKLRELIIDELEHENRALSLEIVAPYLQKLELLNYYNAICIQLRNVASLVTAVLGLDVAFNDEEGNLEKECRYWKELLHNVAHVKNLELGHSGIEFLSILELRGWQSPPSSRKFLELAGALEQSDFPGICSFLQSSPDLETLVINWDRHEPRHLLSQYTNKDEQKMRFETHNFNFSLPQLRTIQIINFDGPLSGNKFILSLVKYFLKNATVLEKFVLVGKFKGRDVSQDYSKMAQELLSFPRSSPHASVVFPY